MRAIETEDHLDHLAAGPTYGKTGGWIMQQPGPMYTAQPLSQLEQDKVASGIDRRMFVSL